MDILQQIINETDAEPIAEINGDKVYTFADGQKVNRRKLAEEKLMGTSVELGERELTDDGIYYTHSRKPVKVVNPDRYFDNRYRETKQGKDKLLEVIWGDTRALSEQATGRIYTKMLNTYVIGKDENGFKVVKKNTISDTEFVNEFKKKLPIKHMPKIAKCISDSINDAPVEEDTLDDFLK